MWAYKQVKESAAPRGELAYKAAKGNFVEAVIRAYKQGTKATPSACCKRTVTCDAMSGNRQRSESTQETSGGVPVETAGDEKDNEQVENNGEEPDSGDEEYQTVLAQEMDSSTVQDSLSNEEAGNCEILYSPPERALDTGQETDTCSEQSPITIQRGPFRKEKPALSQEVPTDMHSINDFSPLLFCGKCGKPLFADSGRYAGVYYKFWKCSSVKRPPFCGANSIRHSVLLNMLDGKQPDSISRIYVDADRITVYPLGASLPDTIREKPVAELATEQESPLVINKEEGKQIIFRRPYGHEIPSIRESVSRKSKYRPYCGICHKRLACKSGNLSDSKDHFTMWRCQGRCGVSIRDAVLSNMMSEALEGGRVSEALESGCIEVFEDRIEVCKSAPLQLGEDNSAIIQRTSFNRELPSISDSQLSYPPLAGSIVCGLCGREMVACKSSSKGKYYTTWKCRTRQYLCTCQGHSIRDAVLHLYLEEFSLSPGSVFRTEVFPYHIKLYLSPTKPDLPVVEKLDDGSTLFHRPLDEIPDITRSSMLSYPKVQHLPYYGRLFCGNCGERLYRDSKGTYGRKYRVWECRSCKLKRIREAVLEEYIEGIEEYDRIEVFSDKVVVHPSPHPVPPSLLPIPAPITSMAPIPAPITSLAPIPAPIKALMAPVPIPTEVSIV